MPRKAKKIINYLTNHLGKAWGLLLTMFFIFVGLRSASLMTMLYHALAHVLWQGSLQHTGTSQYVSCPRCEPELTLRQKMYQRPWVVKIAGVHPQFGSLWRVYLGKNPFGIVCCYLNNGLWHLPSLTPTDAPIVASGGFQNSDMSDRRNLN